MQARQTSGERDERRWRQVAISACGARQESRLHAGAARLAGVRKTNKKLPSATARNLRFILSPPQRRAWVIYRASRFLRNTPRRPEGGLSADEEAAAPGIVPLGLGHVLLYQTAGLAAIAAIQARGRSLTIPLLRKQPSVELLYGYESAYCREKY
jgi:hypothetical protein